jgi:acetyl esterase/lipase
LLEGDAAADHLVRVELTEVSAKPVTVEYRTIDQSATANLDYLESHGTVVFNAGQTSATIPIRILGDATVEPDETISIELSNVTGAILAADRVTVVIENDDRSWTGPARHSFTAADGSRVDASVYMPASSRGPSPVILWVPGDTAYDAAGTSIAALRQTARGYAVLSVTYRAAATARFPAQLVDLRAAVRWLRENAIALGVDGSRIAVWGTGTGAHLAALLGTESSDAATRVQAVVAWGAISDLTSLQSDALGCGPFDWNALDSPVAQLIGCAPDQCPDLAAAASPVRHANAGDAPILLMHGAADCLVAPRQSERFHDALRAVGVDATLRIIDFAGHDDAFWTSAAASAEVDAFLDAKLQGDDGRRRSVRR